MSIFVLCLFNYVVLALGGGAIVSIVRWKYRGHRTVVISKHVRKYYISILSKSVLKYYQQIFVVAYYLSII